MTLVRWNPARDLATMEIDRLNRMFGDFFDLPAHRSWVPAVDVYETDSHEYVIKAELPEINREDISITFDNNVLSVKGERKVEQRTGGTVHRLERQYGTLRAIVRVAADCGRRSHQRQLQGWRAHDSHASARGREAEADRSHSVSRDPGGGPRGSGMRESRFPRPRPDSGSRIPPTGSRRTEQCSTRCRGSRSAAFSCTLLGPCPTLSIRTTPPRRLRRSPPRQSPVAFSSLTSRRSARNSFVAARCRVSNASPAGPHKLERLAMEEVRIGAIHYTLPEAVKGLIR